MCQSTDRMKGKKQHATLYMFVIPSEPEQLPLFLLSPLLRIFQRSELLEPRHEICRLLAYLIPMINISAGLIIPSNHSLLALPPSIYLAPLSDLPTPLGSLGQWPPVDQIQRLQYPQGLGYRIRRYGTRLPVVFEYQIATCLANIEDRLHDKWAQHKDILDGPELFRIEPVTLHSVLTEENALTYEDLRAFVSSLHSTSLHHGPREIAYAELGYLNEAGGFTDAAGVQLGIAV